MLFWTRYILPFQQRIKQISHSKCVCAIQKHTTCFWLEKHLNYMRERSCGSDRLGRDFNNSSSNSWSTEKIPKSTSTESALEHKPRGNILGVVWSQVPTEKEHTCICDIRFSLFLNLLIPGTRPQRGCQLRVPRACHQPGRRWKAFWPRWTCCGWNPSRCVLTLSLIFISGLWYHSAMEHLTIVHKSQGLPCTKGRGEMSPV